MSYQSMPTTIGDDLEVLVWFEYDPPQHEISYGPTEARQPGFPAQVRIGEVLADGRDIMNDLSGECETRLENECLEYVER